MTCRETGIILVVTQITYNAKVSDITILLFLLRNQAVIGKKKTRIFLNQTFI